MALEFTDANFQAEVLDTDKLVLVDFWAPWCGPCKAIGPVIEEIATEYEGVSVGKVNVDNNPAVSTQFKVRSIPTVLLLKNGEILEKFVGGRTKADYTKAIDKHS
ncbi:MAG: thioredoxin 1 [Maribacter sp.]|jgi:thioredoxin 1